ncbi:hypothetical protein [Butyrivibrio sp. INlla16]|uniref:hypothetical protein n=1 Tax=Butyrivibrio sp. INlla16 TaxID=1520807 RepID=UPI000880364E|nr:hypothetical protein [Butyrivibrio sp. INlla16]SDB67326.1 hypothetical protein SAMN02910263_03946 [Butyrivibrio sp. INlla16]
MKTLIVLCAGGTIVNDKPIYLNTHPDGGLIAKKAIENIYQETYDRVIYTILDRECYEYDADVILSNELRATREIEIVRLEELTKGPADTVYKTIKAANIEGSIAIRDSLGSMELTERLEGNFIVGLNLLTYNDSIQRIKSKGFIVANEQNIVLDFMEKRFCSDIISAGLYGFKKGDDFIESYLRLSDPAYNIPRVSVGHVMEHLIGYKDRKFKLGYTQVFEDWGDQIAWYEMQRKRATVFIDLDSMLANKKIDALSEKTIKKMRIVSQNGMRFVFYYAGMTQDSIAEFRRFLVDNDIEYIAFIDRKSQSKEKYFVNSEEDFDKITLGL